MKEVYVFCFQNEISSYNFTLNMITYLVQILKPKWMHLWAVLGLKTVCGVVLPVVTWGLKYSEERWENGK